MIKRVYFFLLLSLVFLSLNGGAQAGLLDVQEVKSPNGITAWLVEDHSVPVVAIEFAFRGAGSAQDPEEKQGLARMVSNTMDEGAGDLNAQAFQKELRDLVISLKFSADRDHFGGSLKTLTKNENRAFELLSMALTSPRFDEEAITRMRASNESRIRSSLSDPEWLAARMLNDKAFSGHPYALNSGGTLSSLSKIKKTDLENFHKTMLGKNNLVVSVSGDITAQELSEKIDQIFSSLPEVKIPEVSDLAIQNQGKTFLYKQDIPQTVISLVQSGIKRSDPQYQTAEVMNFILGSSGFGSRLTEEIREKRGLTYGIYSSLQNMDHVSVLDVSTSTANSNISDILKLVQVEFDRMKDTVATEKELADAKSYLTGSLPLTLTSTDKIASLVLALQLDHLPHNYLDLRTQKIKEITLQDIQTLAETLLIPENFVTILVGNPPETSLKKIKNLEVMDSIPNVQ